MEQVKQVSFGTNIVILKKIRRLPGYAQDAMKITALQRRAKADGIDLKMKADLYSGETKGKRRAYIAAEVIHPEGKFKKFVYPGKDNRMVENPSFMDRVALLFPKLQEFHKPSLENNPYGTNRVFERIEHLYNKVKNFAAKKDDEKRMMEMLKNTVVIPHPRRTEPFI